MRKLIFFLLASFVFLSSKASEIENIYVLKLQDEINAPAWRKVKLAIAKAKEQKADLFLLDLNTYGGRVDFADSIRTALLNLEMKTAVYIRNNAASAGALISIACDSIYMSPGATIGAATVVDGNGAVASEKYQSFFRGKMRATANEKNRDPDIAQGMVDKSIAIEGVVDDKTLITFTTEEAIKFGFCEGKYTTIDELLSFKYKGAKVVQHTVTTTEKIILFLISPAVSGLLIILIIGGIYFEVQSPGIGFPIIMSLIAAVLFFAPHYLQGLVNNWELIAFILGLLFIVIEVFVLPGFGVFGILGILLVILGLAFSQFTIAPSDYGWILPDYHVVVRSLAISTGGILFALIGSYWLSKKIFSGDNYISSRTLVMSDLKDSKILLSRNHKSNDELIGKRGVTTSRLMPGGKITIDDEPLDAIALSGYIENNKPIEVVRVSSVQLVVKEIV